MAVSSSTDFKLSAADLIEEARAKIGIHADEEPLEAHEQVRGLRTLTMMLKAWQADGVMIWTMTEGSFALVQSDVDYVFGSGGSFATVPFEITDMRITRSGRDLPMMQMSRQTYQAIPNKTTEGYPTQWYYDRQRDNGTLYVWPAPDATAGTIKFTYRRIIMDLDAAADDFDLPAEWHEAIVYNLADHFAENSGFAGTPTAQRVAAKAAASYQRVKDYDVGFGTGSLSIVPDDY